MTFVLFFGRLPALRRTPIGALHRLFMIHIPRFLFSLDQKISNGRVYASGAETLRFVMNERHPTVLILFILLLSVSEYLYLPFVFPAQTTATQAVIIPITLMPYIFLYLAAYSDPGFITNATHATDMRLYPYDHVNFHPSAICSTCDFIKPPRSKHCALCKHCVSRSDHHCIFINNCVGYGNTHWFILLLLSTTLLTAAGGYLGVIYISDIIKARYSSFTIRGTGYTWRDYANFWLWGIHVKPGAGGVTLLCVLSTALIAALAAYTLYQVWAGVTTNESGKWDNTSCDIEEESLYMRTLDEHRPRDPGVEPRVKWPVQPKLISMSCETKPPSNAKSLQGQGYGEWVRVESLHDLENVYDIGFWRNIVDLFLPRSACETRYAED
ncbi:hypothetical protein V499_00469 [Pseudogymnoascus sp. VKM F-103]|nr:hypothetical protein V499_00469 [Pseudogymnoascus sp. VKM F-103]